MEPHHIDNDQLGDLDQTIMTFVDEDKKKKSIGELKVPSCKTIKKIR